MYNIRSFLAMLAVWPQERQYGPVCWSVHHFCVDRNISTTELLFFFCRHLWPPENETYPLTFRTEPFWGWHFWGFYPRNMSQKQLVCNEIGPHILLSIPVFMCSHHQALGRPNDTRVCVWIRTIIVPAKHQLISIVSFQLKLCITPHRTASETVD